MTQVIVNTKVLNRSQDLLYILGGSVFLAVMAQFAIPLWFTPVPLTFQTLAIFLLSGLLGSKRGALAALAYLAAGALGLPVFAGGLGGMYYALGATGGYLCAFVISAFLMGVLFEKGWKSSRLQLWITLNVGSLLILIAGALWLGCWVGMEKAWALGIAPFLAGNLLQVFLAFLFFQKMSNVCLDSSCRNGKRKL